MKTKLPKSNAKNAYDLLTDVRKAILEEPKRYNQGWWKSTKGCAGPGRITEWPSCGTVACIAGWVTTLKGLNSHGPWINDAAARILGLNLLPSGTDGLFRASAVEGRPQTVRHARAGAAHIRRFQKKYEKHLKATAV